MYEFQYVVFREEATIQHEQSSLHPKDRQLLQGIQDGYDIGDIPRLAHERNRLMIIQAEKREQFHGGQAVLILVVPKPYIIQHL
jgi:hypothetical protein